MCLVDLYSSFAYHWEYYEPHKQGFNHPKASRDPSVRTMLSKYSCNICLQISGRKRLGGNLQSIQCHVTENFMNKSSYIQGKNFRDRRDICTIAPLLDIISLHVWPVDLSSSFAYHWQYQKAT